MAEMPAPAAYLDLTGKYAVSKDRNGGRDRDRTCDPLDVNEVLSR
jgi:hypothetical protein